jgi:hypothetical protein
MLFWLFSPAFNVAVNDPFRFNGNNNCGGGLSVAMANLWFSLAFTTPSVLSTINLLRNPPSSSGLTSELSFFRHCPESLFSLSYGCRYGNAAGILCGIANFLQFRGGMLIGFATADLVQAYPLISTLWDFFLFGEYRIPVPYRCNNQATSTNINTNTNITDNTNTTTSTCSNSNSISNNDDDNDNDNDLFRIQATIIIKTTYCDLVATYASYLGGIICMMLSSTTTANV